MGSWSEWIITLAGPENRRRRRLGRLAPYGPRRGQPPAWVPLQAPAQVEVVVGRWRVPRL